MWTIFKSLYGICHNTVSVSCFGQLRDMWDLSCLTRLIKPTSPALEDEVSTTGPSGKSPRMNF